MEQKQLQISVISDVHLATHASKAKQLVHYLKSIRTEKLILNGDIVDAWRFSRNYFPKPHLKVIRQIIKMMEQGTEVVYITGNHDDVMRRFNQIKLGKFSIVNQLMLDLNGEKVWIFHGDIFDFVIHRFRWLAKMGAAAYGLLTLLNKCVNFLRRKEIILYKSLKDIVLRDNKSLSKFEESVLAAAESKNCQTVICGHTHIPVDKTVEMNGKQIRYINCGDWVEHFSAAEYADGNWQLVYFRNEKSDISPTEDLSTADKKQIFESILEEFAVRTLFQKQSTGRSLHAN